MKQEIDRLNDRIAALESELIAERQTREMLARKNEEQVDRREAAGARVAYLEKGCAGLTTVVSSVGREEHRAKKALRATEAKLAKARKALGFGVALLEGHRYQWEHDGDEESGQHDEDCRACEYEALIERLRAALSDEDVGT